MIEEGENAPTFTLPGVRDGEITEIRGEEFLGEDIVVLAFYPGDFNPSCADGETGLDELDLFTMQKDVSVLALSGDSVHSHLAFAEEYNLHMPLLSDTDGSVAAEYGVAVDDEMAGYLTRRAVVVVDHAGVVQFTWEGERPGAVPNAEQIRDAINAIGDEDTAQSRYRVGYARYMEGRRAFTSAMKAFEQDEWMIAQTDFSQAAEEFDTAGEEFNTAIRFAEAEESRKYFERAEDKAESLWRAADWLSQSSNAFSSGEGARGKSLRSDAESPLETARELHEPPDPDDFPPETDPAEQDDGTEPPEHFVPQEEDSPDASLDADLDAAVEAQADLTSPAAETAAEQLVTDVPTYGGGESARSRPKSHSNAPGQRPRSYPEENPNTEAQATDADDSAIDDEELEAITAELEQQSESTTEPDEPEINDRSVVPDEITLETPNEGEDENDLDGALAPSTAADGEDGETEEIRTDDTVADEPDDGGASTDGEDTDAASREAEQVDQAADDVLAAERADDAVDDEIGTDGTESAAQSTENTDSATDSVVDDVYTGVVDVSTDVVTQVGGEFVAGDSEDSERRDGEQTDGDTGEDGAIEEDVELDLTEPETEEPDEEVEEADDAVDESGGNHGVPDSL